MDLRDRNKLNLYKINKNITVNQIGETLGKYGRIRSMEVLHSNDHLNALIEFSEPFNISLINKERNSLNFLGENLEVKYSNAMWSSSSTIRNKLPVDNIRHTVANLYIHGFKYDTNRQDILNFLSSFGTVKGLNFNNKNHVYVDLLTSERNLDLLCSRICEKKFEPSDFGEPYKVIAELQRNNQFNNMYKSPGPYHPHYSRRFNIGKSIPSQLYPRR